MRRKALALSLAGALLTVVGVSTIEISRGEERDRQQGVANTTPCDRACLIGIMDQYRSALLAHDVTRLPLASKVRYTENTISLPLGKGLWATANGFGNYKQYFAGPTSGQVGFIGIVKENDIPAILAVRLKVADHRITEIEAIVPRESKSASTLEASGGPLALWDEVLPPSERRSREQLASITNSYFEAIVHSNGSLAPFDKDCRRAENGSYSVLNPDPTLTWDPKSSFRPYKLGCEDQLNTGIWSYIRNIRDRRFPIVDEERGLVVALIMFDHPGTVRYFDAPGFGRVNNPPEFLKPTSMEIFEAFKIRNGLILQVAAEGGFLPYGITSGWEKTSERSLP
jgi:hypothetical protein